MTYQASCKSIWSDSNLLSCNRCGFCMPRCPVYGETLEEPDSPRGRLALIKAWKERGGELPKTYRQRISRCVGCLACAESCPVGINVSDFVLMVKSEATIKPDLLQRFVLNHAISSGKRLGISSSILKFSRKAGLNSLIAKTGFSLVKPNLAGLEYILTESTVKETLSSNAHSFGAKPKNRVGYFMGCAQKLFYRNVAQATIRILIESGYEVIVPGNWNCCGMPHLGAGYLEQAKKNAKQNIDSFNKAGVEHIVTDCATCGSLLKRYGALLEQDSVYSQKALAFSRQVRDLTEYLAAQEFSDLAPASNELKAARVTFHDPCHLGRGQGITKQPREILYKLLGDRFIEMKNSNACCGGGGTYNISHHDISMLILKQKLKSIRETKADIVLTSCPGCQTQIGLGLRKFKLDVRLMHIAEFYYNFKGSPGHDQSLDGLAEAAR